MGRGYGNRGGGGGGGGGGGAVSDFFFDKMARKRVSNMGFMAHQHKNAISCRKCYKECVQYA